MIEVFANGLKFAYWTSATINRAVGNIAAAFSLTLTTKQAGGERVQLFPGDLVQIDVDGVPAVKGFVDKISSSYSAGSHSLTVSGFELTCDLVDCCVEAPLEWTNAKMDKIIADICGKFGIGFYNPMGVDCGEPIKKFSIDPGTKAVEAIGKLCKERGVLPCSNGLGKVYLIKPSAAESSAAIREGVNILSANAEVSVGGIYSDYFVYGSGKAKKQIQAHKSDSDVVRYRPLIIVDANATEKATVEARADWEKSSRKAKSMNLKFSVNGWTAEGKLWQPGTLCSVYSPAVFIDDEIELLISQVSFSLGASGSVTNLTLVDPQSFEPQPETKKAEKNATVKTDVWATIKKAVNG